MSDRKTPPSPHDEDLSPEDLSEDAMETLFSHIGPRAAAPAELKAEVFEAVERAWQQKIDRESSTRRESAPRYTVWAAAALVILAVGAAWLLSRTTMSVDPATRVASARAVATVEAWFPGDEAPGDEADPGLDAGTQLTAGTEVATDADDRAALRLDRGLSLRLDGDTRIRLLDGRSVDLLHGRVYVDSGPDAATSGSESGPSIEIRTRWGHATDVGTQFEVRLDDEALRIQVREGEVRLEVDGEHHAAEAGTELRVDARGDVKRSDLPQGQDWSWAVATAPAFELDGSTLAQALEWVARETGWTVHYQDAALEEEARSIVTRGSLEGVTPTQAPEVIVPTAGLAYAVDGNTLYIQRSGP